jgi:hypothetical protein
MKLCSKQLRGRCPVLVSLGFSVTHLLIHSVVCHSTGCIEPTLPIVGIQVAELSRRKEPGPPK